MVTAIDINILAGELRGASLRNWLRTSGAALIRAGETGAEVLSYLRSGGVEIRTQDFYSIRREVMNVTSSSLRLENYDDNRLIPQKWHVTDHGLDLTTDYQYRVHLYGTDRTTGLVKDEWMTVVSDRQLSKDEVHGMALSYLGEYEEVGLDQRQVANPIFGEVEPLKR